MSPLDVSLTHFPALAFDHPSNQFTMSFSNKSCASLSFSIESDTLPLFLKKTSSLPPAPFFFEIPLSLPPQTKITFPSSHLFAVCPSSDARFPSPSLRRSCSRHPQRQMYTGEKLCRKGDGKLFSRVYNGDVWQLKTRHEVLSRPLRSTISCFCFYCLLLLQNSLLSAHTLKVRSCDAVTSRRPSGVQSMSTTRPSCPSSVLSSRKSRVPQT